MLEVLGIAHWGDKLRCLVCEERGAALERTCCESSDDIAESVWQKVASTSIKIRGPLLVGPVIRRDSSQADI